MGKVDYVDTAFALLLLLHRFLGQARLCLC